MSELPLADSLPRALSAPRSYGVYVALAESLYKECAISLGRAAKLAHMSISEFTAHLSQLGIPVVDYDGSELEEELRYFET